LEEINRARLVAPKMYYLEPARFNGGICASCSQPILAGHLRLGFMPIHSQVASWTHTSCLGRLPLPPVARADLLASPLVGVLDTELALAALQGHGDRVNLLRVRRWAYEAASGWEAHSAERVARRPDVRAALLLREDWARAILPEARPAHVVGGAPEPLRPPPNARFLPTATVTAADLEGEGLGGCDICWQEFKIGETYRRLPCMHLYHAGECIDKWLAKSNTCPRCREPVNVFRQLAHCPRVG
jgi:hypothetical protein